MASVIMQAAAVNFAYGERQVLRGIDITLRAGEVTALLGPNGTGKSTLLKVLLGQVRGSGAITWDGRPVRQWKSRELARFVAYLPQTPAFEPGQTVAEVLRLGRAPYWGPFGLESQHDATAVAEVADLLELSDLLRRPMDEISGGQRQRVFLGRCLAQEPRALLLDEPNTFLDLRHQVDLCRLLKRLAAERSLAILMASHDLSLAAAFADRLILLDGGKAVADGTPEKVMDAELLSSVFGLPLQRIDRPGGRPMIAPETPA
jgi:iron complex transport system ATP-binding protein